MSVRAHATAESDMQNAGLQSDPFTVRRDRASPTEPNHELRHSTSFCSLSSSLSSNISVLIDQLFPTRTYAPSIHRNETAVGPNSKKSNMAFDASLLFRSFPSLNSTGTNSQRKKRPSKCCTSCIPLDASAPISTLCVSTPMPVSAAVLVFSMPALVILPQQLSSMLGFQYPWSLCPDPVSCAAPSP